MRIVFSLLVVALATLYKYPIWNFSAQNKKEIAELRAKKGGSLQKTEIENLPVAVQKWVECSGAAERGAIKAIRLKQIGFMRLKPEQKNWMKAEAEQLITTDPPSFIWTAKMKLNPFLTVIGRDSFQDGKAKLLIKLAALVPLAQVSDNVKADESALQRYLMEMARYPTAALYPYVEWKEVDNTTAEAAISFQGVTGSATFHLDEHGELERIVACRFKDSDENAQRYPCVAEIKGHINVNGISVPSEIEVTWLLEDGPFTWYKFKVEDMEFDFSTPSFR